VKLTIPFTKGKFIDLSVKKVNNLYSLNDHQPIGLDVLGFDGFKQQNQNEQTLIDSGYGSNVTVYSIIKDIAQSGADIPKVLIDENNPDEPIIEGELFQLLQNPAILNGEELTQFAYFEALITFLLSSGNTYQRGLESIGFGSAWQKMEIIPSGIVTPLTANSYFKPVTAYEIDDKAAQFNISAEEILHTKYVNPTTFGLNCGEGLSPLQAALFSLTGSNDIQKAISIMVKNQGVRGILTNKSERSLKPEEARHLSNLANEKLRGVKNFNKVHISNTEMSYLQMGMNATDLKVIESSVLTDRQLCNAYGVSSRLYNDPANSTFNNMKEANKSFFTKAVIPTLDKLLMDINNTWLKQWSERDNKRYKWGIDTSGVEALQADQKTEAEKDKIVMDGVNVVLNMPISSDAKAQLLENEYGFSDKDAQTLVAPVGNLNKTLETLKSLSPLLANKLVEKLTEEEIRNLLK